MQSILRTFSASHTEKLMNQWLRRLRGAVGTGITWALAWGVGGVLIGASTLLPWHPFGLLLRVFDAPLPALGLPGFFGGLFFSAVLGVAGRRRRFRELSAARFALWGAAGGALLTLFPFGLVAVGVASTEGSPHSPMTVWGAIAPVFVALSAASAVGSLLLARRAEDKSERDADPATLELEPTERPGELNEGAYQSPQPARPVREHAQRSRTKP